MRIHRVEVVDEKMVTTMKQAVVGPMLHMKLVEVENRRSDQR